ncbi:MAG: bis(5'-nucleosyl)-tetraphosphatase (symmetrical) YqeK [Oscillospiraceae bacterium]|nr:bis(5'-nucleosyl)-tetraphosphatase (symmetrical) YqeK [Oscillospiraceae bacterium]
MYTLEEIKDILKIRLSKKRYTHSLNVAESAKKLADVYCEDTDKAYLAGLIHDICKEIPKDEQLDMVKKSDRDICPSELVTPALYHAPAGAWYAENALGIHDEDILNAVRYHTIARAGMSPLEEIIYMADLISADRDYKDVGRMRRLAFIDIKQAMLSALKFSVCDVVEKGSQLPVHTVEAYNRYSMAKRKE